MVLSGDAAALIQYLSIRHEVRVQIGQVSTVATSCGGSHRTILIIGMLTGCTKLHRYMRARASVRNVLER